MDSVLHTIMKPGELSLLSIDGISHQIISSLFTYKQDKLGTENDCKVVLNHLIRKFSEPLSRDGNQEVYFSKLINDDVKVIKEHLFPVNEVMKKLLKLELSSTKKELAAYVKELLSTSLVIVNITKEEDDMLNLCGYQQSMPTEYHEQNHELFDDKWARYKMAGIFSNIEIK